MTIEERIVQLGLNNKNFEKGAEQSMRTIDKLEKSLNFTGGIGAFDKLESMIDTVTHRFSALGIAGDQVIRRITDSVVDLVGQMGKLTKAMSIDQIGAGFSKYGEKTTAVATLTAQGYELDKVNKLMEDLNWFTDETSYNFTDMVGNIAKFTATGQDLDSSVTAMEGIALWAALSGQNATKASQAMYQLSQAMGKGALKYDDYKSIQNASMDTQEFRKQAVAAAEQLGVLKKVGEDTWEVIGSGTEKTGAKSFDLAGLFSSDALSRTMWFSSEVMMNVFNKYSKAVGAIQQYLDDHADEIDTASEAISALEKEATELAETAGITLDQAFQKLGYDIDEFSLKAFKAGQNARTWQDTLDSVKDAVSTGWMNIFEKMFGNSDQATAFWTDMANSLYNIFAEPVNKLNELFEIAFGGGKGKSSAEKATGGWAKLEKRIKASGHSMEDFEEAYNKVIQETKDPALMNLVEETGSLEAAFRSGKISGELFKQVLAELTGQSADTGEAVAAESTKMEHALEDYRNMALEVLSGKHGNGSERKKELEDLGYDYEMIQWMVANLGSYHDILGRYMTSDELLDLIQQYKPEYIDQFLEIAGYTTEEIAEINAMLENSDQLLSDIIHDVGEVGEEESKLSGRELFTGGILNVLYALEDVLGGVGDAFREVFGGIDQQGKKLYGFLEKFHNFTENLRMNDEELESFRSRMVQVFQIIQKVGSVIGSGFSFAVNVIRGALDLAGRFYQRFQSLSVFRHFGEAFQNILEGFRAPLSYIGNVLKAYFNYFKSKSGESFFNAITRAVYQLSVKLASMTRKFREFMTSTETIGKIAAGFRKIRSTVVGVRNLFDKLNKQKVFKNLLSTVENLRAALAGPFGIIKEYIGSLIQVNTRFKGKGSFFDWLADTITVISAKMAVASDRFKRFMNSAKTSEKLKNALVAIAKAISSIVNFLKTTVPNAFSTAFQKATEVIGTVADFVKNKIPQAFATAYGKVSAVLDPVIQKVQELYSKLTKLKEEGSESLFTKILSGATKAFEWISTAFQTVKNAITNFFQGENGEKVIEVLKKIALAFVGFKVLKGLGGIFGGILSFLKGLGGIGGFLKDPSGFFDSLKENLMGMFKAEKETEKLDFQTVVKLIRNLAVSLLILAAATWAFSKIDVQKALIPMVAVLGSMATALAVLSKYTKPSKMISSAVALAILGAGLLMVAGAMGIIALIPNSKIANTLVSLMLALVAMAAVLAVLSKKEYANPGRMLVAALALTLLSVGLIAMAAAMGIIALIPANKITTSLLAMVTALAAMSLVLALLSKYADPVGMLAGAVALVLVAGAMAIMALAIAGLGLALKTNEDAMLGFVGVLAVMVIALVALSALGPVVLAAGAALLMAGLGFAAAAAGMILLAVAMRLFEGVDIKVGQLLAFAGALIVMGVAGVIFGLGGLGLLIGGAGLLVLALALNTFNTVHVAPDYLLSFGGALMALGICGIIFGLGGVGLALGGAGLLVLAMALQMMNGVTIAPDYLLGLGGALLALGIGGVVLGLGALGLIFGSAGLAALAKVLPDLAAGVRTFSDISGEQLKATFIALAEAIGALFLLQFATITDGTPVLQALAAAMPAVADGFRFFESVDGDAIAKAGDGLSKAIGALFTLQFATFADGVPVLEELSAAMPGLSAGFKSFETLDGDAIATAGEGLSKAIGALFTLQFASFKDGAPMLEELAAALPGLAAGFESFSGIDSDTISNTGDALGTAVNKLFTLQFSSFKDGSTELTSLATALPELATGFQAFGSMDSDTIAATGDALGGAIDTLFKLQFSTFKDGSPQLVALADALPKIAAGFMAFDSVDGDWLKGIAGSIDTAINKLADGGFFSKKHDYSEMENLGDALLRFWNGLSGFAGAGEIASPIDMVKSLVSIMNTEISNGLPEFEVSGGDIVVSIATGIDSKSGQVTLAIATMMNSIGTAMSGYVGTWNNLGSMVSFGIANGITSAAYAVSDAIHSVASIIPARFANYMEIQSPSRVMARLGEYVSEGVGVGIKNGSSYIESSMITAISPAMAIINALMSSDMEFSPTITPVVDLSNVNAASGSLSSAFGGSYGVSAQMSGSINARLRDVERLASSMEGAGQTINNNGDSITFNIYASEGMDEEAIADAVMNRMQTRMVRRGAAFG